MEMQFRHLEQAIESQPMPPEFQATKAWIYCNDCNVKSSVKYHWLGLKCGVCDSYNTAQLQMIHGSGRRNFPNNAEQELPGRQVRGRAAEISAHVQRTTSSAPPTAVLQAVSPYDPFRRTSRSQEPHPMIHLPLSPDSADEYADGEDVEDSDDVDFWGLESPSSPRGPTGLPDAVPSSSGSEDEDDSDEDMTDDDADNAGEDEEEDQMEIFGHR
ncbi:MAG: hypothetical protein Q9170_005143 [Blastenia crenularia]